VVQLGYGTQWNAWIKAKVEKSVQLVENWILARLRNQTFFSLGELNQAIRECLQALNDHPFQKLNETRRSLYESVDRPVLHPLPVTPFEYADWKQATVGSDYHVEVERHYYSVPYTHIRRKVDIRYTAQTVEIYCRGERIASHVRSSRPGGCTTVREHMPKEHREVLDWTPERLQEEATGIGLFTGRLIERVFECSRHPLQGARTSLGILRLGPMYGSDRLERACERALLIGALTYKSIRSILKKGLDRLPPPEPPPPVSAIQHDNIRGAQYFHQILEGDDSMLTHPILDQMKAMRLFGMAKAFEEQLQMTDIDTLRFEDRLGLLMDREKSEKDNCRLQSRLRKAKLAQSACVEDLDLTARRGLDRTLITKLITCDWVREHLNVIATGPTRLPT
jgi:transposase